MRNLSNSQKIIIVTIVAIATGKLCQLLRSIGCGVRLITSSVNNVFVTFTGNGLFSILFENDLKNIILNCFVNNYPILTKLATPFCRSCNRKYFNLISNKVF